MTDTPTSNIYIPTSAQSTKPKPEEQWAEIKIFARSGMVHFEIPDPEHNYRKMKLTSISYALAKERLKAMYAQCEIWEKRKDHTTLAGEKLRVIRRAAERLKSAIIEAQEQGPYEYADMRRARGRAAPMSLSMSSSPPSPEKPTSRLWLPPGT